MAGQQFSQEEFREGLRLLRTFDLLVSKVRIEGDAKARPIDAVNLFGQALAIMNCTREELDTLWMVFSSAAAATVHVSSDDLFDGLDAVIGRRADSW